MRRVQWVLPTALLIGAAPAFAADDPASSVVTLADLLRTSPIVALALLEALYIRILDKRLESAQAQLVALASKTAEAMASNADALRDVRARRTRRED